MELATFWLIMAIITAMVAASKGRSVIGFFLYGLVIWPIALTHAILSRRPPPPPPRASGRPPATVAEANLPPPEDTAFIPHGMIGGKPFRLNGDGTLTALMDGREVRFPDRSTAGRALGTDVTLVRTLPVIEADFAEGEPVADRSAIARGRSYPSYVAGLAHDVIHRHNPRSRAAYAWRRIQTGHVLAAKREPKNKHDRLAVALFHNDFPIGYIPASQRWVQQSLDEGDTLDVRVDTVEKSRADPNIPFIGLRITVIADTPRTR